MIVQLNVGNQTFKTDLTKGIDISLPVRAGNDNPSCYGAEPVKMETIRSGDFVGSVKEGGSVNYQKLSITPHGNSTHTECYGHISADDATLHICLTDFHFLAEVITVEPQLSGSGDFVIMRTAVEQKIKNKSVQAVAIRSWPNTDSKKTKHYSDTNPPYLDHEAAAYLAALGVDHLLIDLPSVDRERDGGRLRAHKAFWQFPEHIRKHATITELVYIPDFIYDGLYLLNLQITSLEMDASPSKPVLYKLTEVL